MSTVTILVPVELQDAANQIALGMGTSDDDDQTFGAWKLSPTGAEPATHLGCNTWAADSFVETVRAVQAGQATIGQVVAQAYTERFPDLTPPSEYECAAFMASAVIAVDAPWQLVVAALGLEPVAEHGGTE